MDPISVIGLVASIPGIIQAVVKLVLLVRRYIQRSRTPPHLLALKDTIEYFIKALETFKTALEALKEFADKNPKSRAFALLHNSHGPFLGCGKALELTLEKLRPARGLKAIFKRPKWPISQEETSQLTKWVLKQTRVFQAAVKPDMSFLERIAFETNLAIQSLQRGSESVSKSIGTRVHTAELAIQQAGDILHITRDKRVAKSSLQESDQESSLSLVLRWLYPDKIAEKQQQKAVGHRKIKS